MSDNDLIIIVGLAALAGFLLLRLRNVLGERDGFEDHERMRRTKEAARQAATNGTGGVVTPLPSRSNMDQDDDIFAFAEPSSELGKALKSIKEADPSFQVREFMEGARGAYEMILTAFENGDVETLRPFLDQPVFTAFSEAIEQRNAKGLSVDMRFVGFRSAEPTEARFVTEEGRAEVTVRFVAEVVTATRNAQGEVVEGDLTAVQKINDVWTFARTVASDDPNWLLIATDG